MLAFWFGLLGTVVGRFLNLYIDRWPSGQSIFSPPPHCPECGHRLKLADLLPLVSYVALGGRCRYCASRTPVRELVVEAASGVSFAVLWLRYGPGIPLVIGALYTSVSIIIAFIDLKHQIIPNRIVYPAMGLALVAASITPGRSPSSVLVGGLVGFGFLFLVAFVHPAGMGMGDVRFAGFIGLVTGYPSVVVGLLMAIVLGGLVGALLLLFHLKGRRDPIPFGPFLALGGFVSLLYGQELIRWYLA